MWMIVLLYLRRWSRVLAIRVLHTLLTPVEHIVLIGFRLSSAHLRVPRLRRLLLILPRALRPIFLSLPISLLILDMLYLCHELLPQLIVLVLVEDLDLGAQRLKILHERWLSYDGIVLLLPYDRGPRLLNLSTRGVIASTAITIIIVLRVTPKVVEIAILTGPSQVVASSIPRSGLLLHDLINHLLELFKFEILLPNNFLVLLLLLPELVAAFIDALNLCIELIFQLLHHSSFIKLAQVGLSRVLRLSLHLRHFLHYFFYPFVHLSKAFIFVLQILLQFLYLLLRIFEFLQVWVYFQLVLDLELHVVDVVWVELALQLQVILLMLKVLYRYDFLVGLFEMILNCFKLLLELVQLVEYPLFDVWLVPDINQLRSLRLANHVHGFHELALHLFEFVPQLKDGLIITITRLNNRIHFITLTFLLLV